MSKRKFQPNSPQFKSVSERAVFELLKDGTVRSSTVIRKETDLVCTRAINSLVREGVVERGAHEVGSNATAGYRLAERYLPAGISHE